MKVFHKIIATILLFLFATETFGVYRYVHFCGGEPTSESYFVQEKECCCDDVSGESTEMDDCCKDEVKVVQIDDRIIAPVTKNVNTPKALDIIAFHLVYSEIAFYKLPLTLFSKTQEDYKFYDSSPPIRHLVCSYLI